MTLQVSRLCVFSNRLCHPFFTLDNTLLKMFAVCLTRTQYLHSKFCDLTKNHFKAVELQVQDKILMISNADCQMIDTCTQREIIS